MKKRVLIYAYLEGNLGDDLMVYTLCRRYPEIQFEVLAHQEYKKRFRGLTNLKVYGFDDRKVRIWNQYLRKLTSKKDDFFCRLVKKAYALVHIGGSVYTQHENYQATYFNDITLRNISKRMFVCGANFGPYQDESYYENYQGLLSRYDGVCFRDQYSYELFKHLPCVRYAPDVVFNYRECSRENALKEKKLVLVSVIQMKSRKGNFPISQYTENYQRFMAEILEKYVDHGYRIRFVAFCKAQGDEDAAKEIVNRMRETSRQYIEEYVYDDDIEEAVRQFDEAEVVIGTRFHSVILGWLKGKKVIPVIYDQKTLHTLEDVNWTNYVTLPELETTDIDKLMEEAKRLPEDTLEQLIEKAAGQFADLDKVFYKEK